jgi:diguanylate cyclase (GGDEF)-like protein
LHQCFKIGVAPRTIGSGQNADIVLNDDRIASVHCRISLQDGEVRVDDLGSEAGTWIDDQRVVSARLEPGRMLRIGHFRLMMSLREARIPEVRTPVSQSPGTDRLSGVPNRAWILRRAEQVLETRADSPRPVTLAIMALDHLARVHNEKGYSTGDLMLRSVAHLAEGRLREKESMGSCGPEKFLLLLPEVDAEDAQVRLDAVRQAVSDQHFDAEGEPLSITLSIGYATQRGCDVESLDQFLTRAERALYRARRLGGNQVVTLDQNR